MRGLYQPRRVRAWGSIRTCLTVESPYSPPMTRRLPGTRMRTSCIGVAFLMLAAFPSAAQTVNDPGLQVEVVAGGLAQPTTTAFIADNDILVLQKANGQVRRVIGGILQAAPV